MKIKHLLSLVFAVALFAACDDTTDKIGGSLTNITDRFNITDSTFNVSTRSITVDSVLSRSIYSYLGHIKDPETGTYVTSNYTASFSVIENLMGNTPYFPSEDSIVSKKDGFVVADSCILQILVKGYVGDSLNPMRLTLCELDKPVEENVSYYTNFDPEASGMLRGGGNQIKKNKVYTVMDLNLSDSARNSISSSGTTKPIKIRLNDKYVGKNNVEYDNYGTYLMRKYYENQDNYKNSYNFAHNVCPGFYIKTSGGLGVMSEIEYTSIVVYYRRISNDTIYNNAMVLSGTEEVMQTNTIVNDKERTKQLADDPTCTYLKAPAGIFTEVTLPIDSIMAGHENDTLSSAKIVFTRINPVKSENSFSEPTRVLILPKDSLYSFFEQKDLPDNIKSYLATYDNSLNTYTFNNIAGLVSAMYQAKKNGTASTDDWNKAVLVPVAVNESSSSTSTTITNVSNEMSLKSTKLIGGPNNTRQPITISVIYNRFNK